ncbi:Hypothetical predicted protein [Lecanosticta acicola]|uniref:Rab-GAP TBC domain-containing protein n=1 Tax=Lecanosticta acicola TaxID=111012 RepID=A0AAI9EBT1_9PEZI|nr:Hypothetical predicted protein [Lecanosticta acicola]
MHIAEQTRGWEPEHHLSVAEAIREAMNESAQVLPLRSRPMRRGGPRGRPTVQSPRDLPAPEPHLPLRKASAHSRLQYGMGSVSKPLFAPTHDHSRVRGFNPTPVQPPLPQLENITASDEHAFAGREAKRPFRPALGVLEHQQQTLLQYAEREPVRTERDADANVNASRPPSSPPFPYQASPQTSPAAPRKRGHALKNSRSVGDGLRGMRHRMTNKRNTDLNGRLTPDSPSTRPSIATAPEEIRKSFRSALTSHSSIGPASSINTTQTSISGRSSPNGSFVKVRREDWDEGGLSDVDMSVEDAIGMYENGFESGPGSAKGSMDVRSLRSFDASLSRPGIETRNVDRGRLTPDAHSLRSLQMERPERSLSQPRPQPTLDSEPSTPTKAKRPNAAHRRSQSASILILGVPKSARSGVSPSPSARTSIAPETTPPAKPNQQERPATGTPTVSRDRYGFKKASQYITVDQYDAWNASYSKHIERRSKKWHALMRSYGLHTCPPIRFPPKSEKIKRYVRKGIPPEFRGAAWFWYAGGPGLLKKEPCLYRDLLEKVENGELSDNDREHIERDLNRTFPDNIRFKPDPTTTLDAQADAGGGIGGDKENSRESRSKNKRKTKEPETPILRALRRLLQAFAVHNPQIGYCQSLNFIAGLLLLFLDEDEEKAFVLLNVVTTQHLPGTHGIALEGANIDIAVLMSCIKDTSPAIWNRLDDKGGMGGVGGLVSGVGGAGALRLPTVSLATTAWFMSLFVGTLPIESVLRVWDCLFFEGSKTLFRIALSIFKHGEQAILNVSDPMEIFQVVQTIPRSMLDINALMEICFRRRGGFGGVSQGLVESRRADRRRVVKEGVSAAAQDEGAFRKLRGRLKKSATKP